MENKFIILKNIIEELTLNEINKTEAFKKILEFSVSLNSFDRQEISKFTSNSYSSKSSLPFLAIKK